MPRVDELHQALKQFESPDTPPEQRAQAARRVCFLSRKLLAECGLKADQDHETQVGDAVMEVFSRIEAGDFITMSERSYRRGVSQALEFAAVSVRNGCTVQDLETLADEAEEMRCDHGPHLAYLDELMSRCRNVKVG